MFGPRRKHCTVCHSAKNLKEPDISGGLALDTPEAVLKGMESGPVVRKGEGAESLLVKVLVTTNAKRRMPLDAPPLPKETIDVVRKWIDGGIKEGKRSDDDAETPKTIANRRLLDVTFPTNAQPPAGAFGKIPAGKLTIALKIGPLAPVAAVAFSPNDKLLATGSYGQVAVWDLEHDRPVKVLTNVLGAVNDLKFSPDGSMLAVAGGQPSAKGDLRLYQTSDWKLVGVLRGHDDVVFSIAFSPDGKQLASASFDHTIRLWKVADQSPVQTFKNHSDFVYAVAFDPMGAFLYSASKDRTVQMFDRASGKSKFTFSGVDQDVMALAVRPDGKSIVSAGFDAGVQWWNTQTGEKLKTTPGHGIAVHELVFSKDGSKLLSAGADRTAKIHDGVAGTLLKTLPVGSPVYAIAISGNKKLVATGSFDGIARLWDEATGRHLASLYARGGASMDWLAVTPEGYASGSPGFVKESRWLMGAAALPNDAAWGSLGKADFVARAFRGEAVPPPTFGKEPRTK
ncbi:MAG: c-type cytochrome domain-containing protein [Gemmataceae bacterium]